MDWLLPAIPAADVDWRDLRASRKAAHQVIDPGAPGDSELVHPDVLDAGEPWSGYRYWMAVTPYEGSDSQYENPCILASHDAYSWEVPAGLTNPIHGPPASGYYSDVDLHLSPDSAKLVCVFRHSDGGDDFLYAESSDGVTWSAPATLLDFGVGAVAWSPSVLWDGAQYVMFYLGATGGGTRPIHRRTAPVITGPWSEPTTVWESQLGANETPWHQDTIRVDGVYYMLVDAEEVESGLWLLKSHDGLAFAVGAEPVMAYGTSSSQWDRALYRSTIWPVRVGPNLSFGMYYGSYLGPHGYQIARADLYDSAARHAQREALLARVEVGAFPALAADDFAGASLGTALTGQNWEISAGSWAVDGGAAHPSADANSRAVIECYSPDVVARMTVEAVDTEVWLVVRFAGGGSYLRFGGLAQANFQAIGGTIAPTVVASRSITPGAVLEVRCRGDELRGYVNGVLCATVTTAFNQAATVFGVQANRSATRVAGFSVRAL